MLDLAVHLKLVRCTRSSLATSGHCGSEAGAGICSGEKWDRASGRRALGGAGAGALCCGGPGDSPGRCLGTPWPPGWRVLPASGRWRPGVFHAPRAAIPKEPRGPSRPACYPHLHRALDVSAASPPHQWCSDLGLSIGLRDASG